MMSTVLPRAGSTRSDVRMDAHAGPALSMLGIAWEHLFAMGRPDVQHASVQKEGDLRVCESTEVLTSGSAGCTAAGRAGEPADAIWPLMDDRAASRRDLSASRASISASFACSAAPICDC